MKILRLSRRTLPSWNRQSAESQSRTSPSGPFTPRAAIASANACPVIVPNLPFGSGGRGRSPSKTHPVHVSTLSGPGTLSRIRPVIQGGRRRTRPCWPGFPSPFGAPAFASRAILFPPGNSASLTVGLPAADATGPRRGSHVPLARDTTGKDALYAPGAAVSTRPGKCPSRRLPLHSGQPLHPGNATHQPELTLTRRHQGFTHVTRPVFPSPAAPGWNGNPLGLNPELRTPRLPATHVRAGTASNTKPGLHHRLHRPSRQRAHSLPATSCRTTR